MSAYQIIAALIGGAALLIMTYGYGFFDGRDSMRKQLKGDSK